MKEAAYATALAGYALKLSKKVRDALRVCGGGGQERREAEKKETEDGADAGENKKERKKGS